MITLTPKSLNELAQLTEEVKIQLRKQAKHLDVSWPGWREKVDTLLGDDDEDPDAWLRHAKEKQLKAELERSDGLTPEAVRRLSARLMDIESREGKLTIEGIIGGEPEPEYPREAHCHMPPFYGYGRLSPDGRYHLVWGKVDNDVYRVGVSENGAWLCWLEPSCRIVDGWVSNGGLFVVKAHVSEDEVEFAFAEQDGNVFHHWQRPWRFLQFLRFDADGMGYAYDDDEGLHEVRFAAD